MRLLVAIFILSLLIRFLYFPDNIYFGFDQARDGFATKEILSGNLKLVGPPTTFEGLNHGVLYYYIYAPFYLLSNGDPASVAALLRIVNALGIFLIFVIAAILFNRQAGFIAAFLYAISFEQTQFALYLNHPSFAVISILIMFLGLTLLIFKGEKYGLIIAMAGLGLSIQFEFLLTYLVVTFALILFIFRKEIPKLGISIKLLGFPVLFLTTITYVVSEIRFGFRSLHTLSELLFNGSEKSITKIVSLYLFEMGQVIKFNLLGPIDFKLVVGLVLFVSFLILLRSNMRNQLIFLGIWFFSVIIIYFIGGSVDFNVEVVQYHPNVGISLSLIIFISYLLYLIGNKFSYTTMFLIIIFIGAANFSLIQKINSYGSMPEINAQSFMLLSDQKKVLDYIYKEADNGPFAVKAITLPFFVNTTWSYLFEWYGLQKYGYLPTWNGNNALGYPGNLFVEDAQDKAPPLRFLIMEPPRGIPVHLTSDYLREESYFSDIKSEIEIGKFKVQKRYKK